VRRSVIVGSALAVAVAISGAALGGVFTSSRGTTKVESRFQLSVTGTEPDNSVRLSSVNCPSATKCIAVGWFTPWQGRASESRGLFLVLNRLEVESVYVGPLGSFNQAVSVSCASSYVCVAVGTQDNQAAAWSLAGGRWTTRYVAGDNTSLQSVSCASRSFCIASGQESDGKPSMWRGDGRRWTAMSLGVTKPESIGSGGEYVQCLSPRFCAASGSEDPSLSNCVLCEGAPTPVPWVSTFDGSVWHTVTLKVPRPGGLLDVLSCASASQCIAGGSMWPPGTSDLVTSTAIEDTWNGVRWSEDSTGVISGLRDVQAIDDVACAPRGCMLTGEYGGPKNRHRFQLKLTRGRQLLFTQRVDPGELENFNTLTGCGQDGWCLLIVQGGVPNVNGPPVYFTNQSVGTERQLVVPRSIVDVYDLDSLSCASSRWCMAVGIIPFSASLHPTIPIVVWNGTAFVGAYLHSREVKGRV
jgi:hypothetical protein